MASSDSSVSQEPKTVYRVVWGLGRSEDFATAEEAGKRHDELYADIVETWPMLAGTNDAVLPRLIEVQE